MGTALVSDLVKRPGAATGMKILGNETLAQTAKTCLSCCRKASTQKGISMIGGQRGFSSTCGSTWLLPRPGEQTALRVRTTLRARQTVLTVTLDNDRVISVN